jgi:hypothetical protein
MSLPTNIKRILPVPIKRRILAVKSLPSRRHRLEVSSQKQLIDNFRRIYFIHIRKTAGTSLNHAFIGLSGSNPGDFHEEIMASGRGWGERNRYVYVCHNNFLIEEGNYFYGHSHTPFHQLRLKDGTFTVTCLRDPVRRVVSHYRNLAHYKKHNSGPATMKLEGAWVGDSLSDFIQRVPREHLLRQLYMFSPTFNVDQAVENINSLDSVMYTESFDQCLKKLGDRLGFSLASYRSKGGYDQVDVHQEELERLRELLEPEYTMLEKLNRTSDS